MTHHRIRVASQIFAAALVFSTAGVMLSACAGIDPAPYTPVNADYER